MKQKNRGLGLIELLLVLGAISAGSAIVYGTYQYVVVQHRQDVALRQVRDTIGRVTSAFMTTPNYTGLSQERAIEDGLFGPDVVIEEGRAIAPWGGELFVSPTVATLANGGTVEAGAFSLTLRDVPGPLCPQMASTLTNARPNMTINDRPLPVDSDGLVNVATLAEACAAQPTSTVVLTFPKANAGDGLKECLAPTGLETRNVPCSEGLTGTRTEQREASCPQRYGQVQWTAWQETGNNCSNCPGPETQQVGCGPNQYGQQQQQRTFDCAGNRWNGWVTLSSDCQACPTEDEYRTVACEAGRAGQIVQRRTFVCVTGQWTAWQTSERQCQPQPPLGASNDRR